MQRLRKLVSKKEHARIIKQNNYSFMTQQDYLKMFKQLTDEMMELTRKKNSDYADRENAFQNFELIEKMGVASTEQGFMVRMSDKLQRIGNLIGRENAVKEESIEDTLKDLSIYSLLFLIYLKRKD